MPASSPGPDAWVTDYNRDGEVDELEQMKFNDEELGGGYFSPWTSYQHPELGEVEVGGWHRKFWGQNPRPELLVAETVPQMPWILYLAEQSPLRGGGEPSVTDLGDGTYRVEVVEFEQAVKNLSNDILVLQGNGDYEAVAAFVAKMGNVGQQLQADLNGLDAISIPVDIGDQQGKEALDL